MTEILVALIGMISIAGGVDCPTPTMKAYTVLPNYIFICKDKELVDIEIVHELSHIMFYSMMNDTERNLSKLLFKYCSEKECFYRPYGMTNQLEDFSTSFESYYLAFKNNDGDFSHITNRVLRAKHLYIGYLINKYK